MLYSRRAALVLFLLACLVLPTAAFAGVPADLVVTKTDSPDPVLAGQNITYTITLTNIGGSPASNVTVTDGIPAQATYVSFSPAPGFTVISEPAVGATGTVIASTPSFPAGGSAVFTLVVRANPNLGSGATITNTASTNSVSDPGGGSDTVLTTVGTAADLVVTKTDSPDPVVAGTDLTYTLTVTNEGPSDSQNVTLSDAIPAGTTFVSATQTSGPPFVPTIPAPGGGGTFSASISPLAAGASATFELVVRVDPDAPPGTPIDNTASATSPVTTDPDPADNSDGEQTAVVAQADLTLTKADSPDPVAAGDDLTYTLTLTNAGPSDAASVALTDPIPAGTTFVSASQTSGPAFTLAAPAPGSGGTFSATADSFAAGATATFTLVVRVNPSTPAATSIANTASVTTTTADAGPGTPTATAATTTTGGTAGPTIPTLSAWMMIVLAAALAALALRTMR